MTEELIVGLSVYCLQRGWCDRISTALALIGIGLDTLANTYPHVEEPRNVSLPCSFRQYIDKIKAIRG